jgi:hypothetical protein
MSETRRGFMKVTTASIATIIAICGLAPLLGSASPAKRNTVQTLPPMHSSRAAHTLTVLKDGRVLVVGGFTSEEDQIAGVELFDAEQDRFDAIDNLNTPRQSHTATLLSNGRVLIAGGYDAQVQNLATAEVFDPITQKFLSVGRMTVPRANHTAVVLGDGNIALIGGTGTNWTALDSIEIFDPNTGAFSTAGHMLVPRGPSISVLLRDGRIFIAGGAAGRGSNTKVYNSSEIFDPRSGQSISSGTMAIHRNSSDGVLLADGRVLITGRSVAQDASVERAEIFDPSSNTFTLAATMQKARYKHRGSSVLLPNGKVLIAGGAAEPELYDPTTDTFETINSESRLHGSFSGVALLRDNRVLITGGYFQPVAPSNGAWIYRF